MNTTLETPVRLIASSGAWIEGEAVRQLYACARLDGMRQAVGFPDLHPGKGVPVGAAFVTEGIIYPHLIGGDIGCGMTLWQTDLPLRKAKVDRWTKLPFNLERRWDGNLGGWLQDNRLASSPFDASMGTLGGGNHFAELQAVEEICDGDEFTSIGLRKADLVLLVHSGSRDYGESIFRAHVAEHGADGVAPESPTGATYLAQHNLALRWAQATRVRAFSSAFDRKPRQPHVCSTLGSYPSSRWENTKANLITRWNTSPALILGGWCGRSLWPQPKPCAT